MKLSIKTRFSPGDQINSVFWDDDIGAWNTESWQCYSVKVVCKEDKQEIHYCQTEWDEYGVPEDEDLFETSFVAARAVRMRNKDSLIEHKEILDCASPEDFNIEETKHPEVPTMKKKKKKENK